MRKSTVAARIAILAMLAGYATILWDARQRGLARWAMPVATQPGQGVGGEKGGTATASPEASAGGVEVEKGEGQVQVPAEAGKAAGGKGPRAPRAIYEEQRGIAVQSIDMMNRSMEIGAPVVGMPTRVVTWSVVLLQAELYLSLDGTPGATDDPEVYLAAKGGSGDTKKVKIFRDHLERMRVWEDRFRPLQERGAMSALEFLEFQSARVRAEGWLARELGVK